jgi:hypothetical protein
MAEVALIKAARVSHVIVPSVGEDQQVGELTRPEGIDRLSEPLGLVEIAVPVEFDLEVLEIHVDLQV